jgi:hypothetical protein
MTTASPAAHRFATFVTSDGQQILAKHGFDIRRNILLRGSNSNR